MDHQDLKPADITILDINFKQGEPYLLPWIQNKRTPPQGVEKAMTPQEFEGWYLEHFGDWFQDPKKDLAQRLGRVKAFGYSMTGGGYTLRSFIRRNRLGPNERELDEVQFRLKYLPTQSDETVGEEPVKKKKGNQKSKTVNLEPKGVHIVPGVSQPGRKQPRKRNPRKTDGEES